MIEVLTNNHYDKILDLFDGVQNRICIVSPFISVPIADKLCEIVKKKGLDCSFITRIYLEDMICKANSLDAINSMIDSGIKVYSVKGLHTKLYLFDSERAILGSANFTSGGFKSNIELSLFISEEPVVVELQEYFNVMKEKLLSAANGMVTKEIIKEAKEQYKSVYSLKKGSGNNFSIKMYGADIGLIKPNKAKDTDYMINEVTSASKEKDIVNDLFSELKAYDQVKYDYNIWVKFSGTGISRVDSESVLELTGVTLNGKTVYVSTYPTRPSSVNDGDMVYYAALSTDIKGKNQPVIVGRGYLRGFDRNNKVLPDWLVKYPWMEHYQWYCIIDSCVVLNTEVKNGIPLDEVLDVFGSDTYISSFGRNESIAEVSKKHFQKAHIRISGNAKEYIDKKFDELANKYGTVSYNS